MDGEEASYATVKSKKQELNTIDQMAASASLASDTSLFEDIGLNPIPLLSGACRGYGFAYTEDFPKRTNEHSKPYVIFLQRSYILFPPTYTNFRFSAFLVPARNNFIYPDGRTTDVSTVPAIVK